MPKIATMIGERFIALEMSQVNYNRYLTTLDDSDFSEPDFGRWVWLVASFSFDVAMEHDERVDQHNILGISRATAVLCRYQELNGKGRAMVVFPTIVDGPRVTHPVRLKFIEREGTPDLTIGLG